MPFTAELYEELDALGGETKRVLIKILKEIETVVGESIKRSDFLELKDIVRDLAIAQKRTEERIDALVLRIQDLVEAQRRTEERLNELAGVQKKTEERMNELAEAQRRTEERLDQLAVAQAKTEERMNELAEAQRRTEERLNELAQAQRKTEEKLKQLAEAQRRTEEELSKLIREHIKTREQIGSLSHTVGYVLEDRAYTGLPPLLEKDYGCRLIEPLRRDYIKIGRERFIELNIFGKGEIDGEDVWIIGDSKTQMKKKDIDEFVERIKKLEKILSGKKILISVTYQTSPPVREYAKDKGVKIYFSYQFPL